MLFPVFTGGVPLENVRVRGCDPVVFSFLFRVLILPIYYQAHQRLRILISCSLPFSFLAYRNVSTVSAGPLLLPGFEAARSASVLQERSGRASKRNCRRSWDCWTRRAPSSPPMSTHTFTWAATVWYVSVTSLQERKRLETYSHLTQFL